MKKNNIFKIGMSLFLSGSMVLQYCIPAFAQEEPVEDPVVDETTDSPVVEETIETPVVEEEPTVPTEETKPEKAEEPEGVVESEPIKTEAMATANLGSNSYAGDEEKLYKFTASSSGYVLIMSGGNDDTYVTLYDQSGEVIESNDDSGINNNFFIYKHVTKGEVIQIGVRTYNEEYASFNFYITMADTNASLEPVITFTRYLYNEDGESVGDSNGYRYEYNILNDSDLDNAKYIDLDGYSNVGTIIDVNYLNKTMNITAYESRTVTLTCREWSTDEVIDTIETDLFLTDDSSYYYTENEINGTYYSYSVKGFAKQDESGKYVANVYYGNEGDMRTIPVEYYYDTALVGSSTASVDIALESYELNDVLEPINGYIINYVDRYDGDLIKCSVIPGTQTSVHARYVNWATGEELYEEDVELRITSEWYGKEYSFSVNYDFIESLNPYSYQYGDPEKDEDGNWIATIELIMDGQFEKEVPVRYVWVDREVVIIPILLNYFDDVTFEKNCEEACPEGYTFNYIYQTNGEYICYIIKDVAPNATYTVTYKQWSTDKTLSTVKIPVQTSNEGTSMEWFDAEYEVQTHVPSGYKLTGVSSELTKSGTVYKQTIYVDKTTSTRECVVNYVFNGKTISSKTLKLKASTISSTINKNKPANYYCDYNEYASGKFTVHLSKHVTKETTLKVTLIDWASNEAIGSPVSIPLTVMTDTYEGGDPLTNYSYNISDIIPDEYTTFRSTEIVKTSAGYKMVLTVARSNDEKSLRDVTINDLDTTYDFVEYFELPFNYGINDFEKTMPKGYSIVGIDRENECITLNVTSESDCLWSVDSSSTVQYIKANKGDIVTLVAPEFTSGSHGDMVKYFWDGYGANVETDNNTLTIPSFKGGSAGYYLTMYDEYGNYDSCDYYVVSSDWYVYWMKYLNVKKGDSATLEVEFEDVYDTDGNLIEMDPEGFTYQWYKENERLNIFEKLSGETNKALDIEKVKEDCTYLCVITDEKGDSQNVRYDLNTGGDFGRLIVLEYSLDGGNTWIESVHSEKYSGQSPLDELSINAITGNSVIVRTKMISENGVNVDPNEYRFSIGGEVLANPAGENTVFSKKLLSANSSKTVSLTKDDQTSIDCFRIYGGKRNNVDEAEDVLGVGNKVFIDGSYNISFGDQLVINDQAYDYNIKYHNLTFNPTYDKYMATEFTVQVGEEEIVFEIGGLVNGEITNITPIYATSGFAYLNQGSTYLIENAYDITLSDSLIIMNKGETATLEVVSGTGVSLYSTNPGVANINGDGVIETGEMSGQTTIVATNDMGVSAKCKVIVLNPIDQIALDKTTLSLVAGNTEALECGISPTDATGSRTIKWTSSNPEVATVTQAGVIKGKVAGNTTITATSVNGIEATCEVTVKPSKTSISSITNSTSGTVVNWAMNPSASGYYLYRGSTKIATFETNDVTSYTDKKAKTNGTKYTYKIVAFYQGENTTVEGTILKASTSSTVTSYYVSRPTISSVTNLATKKMRVKLKARNTTASGWQIQYSAYSDFSSVKTVTVTGNTTLTKDISSLTKGKKYYVRTRWYKTVSGKKYYSAWSAKKYVTIKK